MELGVFGVSIGSLVVANSSVVIPAPVVPENDVSGGPSQSFLPAQNGQLMRHRNAEDAVTNSEKTPVNSENIIVPVEHTAGASTGRLLQGMTSADVVDSVGSGSVPSVRFRGTRAFEPFYYWNGIPLSGVFGGAQTLELVPASLIRSARAYPDVAPWWFPMSGIAGAVDFLSCSFGECAQNGQGKNWGATAAVEGGSFGYSKISSSLLVQTTPKSLVQGALQYERSREDFLYRNNNGTVFRTDDDFDERRRNNDYSRALGGVVAAGVWPQSFSTWQAYGVGGAEERGLSGSIESRLTPRLTRYFSLWGGEMERLNPNTGLRQGVAVGVVADGSEVRYQGEKPVGFAPSKTTAKSGHLTLRSQAPTDLWFPGVLGFSVFVSRSAYEGEMSGFFSEKMVASRTELTSAVFRSFVPWESGESAVSLDATLKANLAASKAANQEGTLADPYEKEAFSSVVSLQVKENSRVYFLRHTTAMRRPWLRERYGEAGGLLPSPDIRAESTRALEVGLSVANAQAHCFLAEDSNLIVLDATDARNGKFRNLDDVQRRGCLLNAEVLFWNHVKPHVSLRMNDSTFVSPWVVGRKKVPRSPSRWAQGGVSFENFGFSGFQWESKISALWQESSYLDMANQVLFRVPVRWNAGMFVNWATPGWQVSSARMGVELFDFWRTETATETDALGRDQSVVHSGFSGFPWAGRRIVVSASVQW